MTSSLYKALSSTVGVLHKFNALYFISRCWVVRDHHFAASADVIFWVMKVGSGYMVETRSAVVP